MVECEWQAWYDSEPAADRPLHVAADVVSEQGLGELRLVEDTTCECPSEVVCLTLEAEQDEARPGPTHRLVSWSGLPDEPISEVRVDGVVAATVGVDAPG